MVSLTLFAADLPDPGTGPVTESGERQPCDGEVAGAAEVCAAADEQC